MQISTSRLFTLGIAALLLSLTACELADPESYPPDGGTSSDEIALEATPTEFSDEYAVGDVASDVASDDVSLVAAFRPRGVSLGRAGTFAILAKSGISTVPPAVITGNIGVSPIAATAITGFSLTMHSSNVYSTSPQVTGNVYAASYASPTPSNMTTAIGDMQTAYTDAAGRAPNFTELGAGNIGGRTLVPGVYKWSSAVLIPTSVTLRGSSTDIWIFQIAQGLTMSSSTRIILTGGAQARNIYWQVAGQATLGTKAHLEGIVLSKTAITLGTDASVNGRLLAQTAVTLIKNTVVRPL